MILIFILILVLITFITCNTINDIDTTNEQFDIKRQHYHKGRTYDIVIAHCKKNMDWVEELMNLCGEYKLRILIYSKCGNIETLNHLRFKKGAFCLGLTPMSNFGREAYIYLYHIINHYDRLPTMTFFMQDDTKEKENVNIISELVDVLKSRNGYYSLSHTISPMGTIPDADEFKKIFLSKWIDPFFYHRVFLTKEMWTTNWRATFAVSSARILHLPLDAYKDAISVSNCTKENNIYNLCPNDFFEIIWGAMFSCYIGPDGSLFSGSSASSSDYPQNKKTTLIYNCANIDDNKTMEKPLELNTYILAGSTAHQSIHYPNRNSFELGQYGEDCNGLLLRCYDFY